MKDVLVAAERADRRGTRRSARARKRRRSRFLDTLAGLYVVKTDGLAAGKGVVVTESLADARDAVRAYLSGEAFGDAGPHVRDRGRADADPSSRCSRCATGRSAVVLGVAQDHKRVFDGDQGPNTGGMGAYSPVPFVVRRRGRTRDGAGHQADARRAGAARRRVPRRVVLRAHAHARRPEGHRVQRPVRRPGVPGARPAPRERPLRASARVRARVASRRRSSSRTWPRVGRRARVRGVPARVTPQG